MATLEGQREATGSTSWQQIAGLKVRLRSHLQFFQHQYRGQHWYVLVDKLANQQFRCSSDIHTFLGLLDGHRSLQQALSQTRSQTQTDGPSHQEIVQLILSLAEADMLQGDLLQNDQQRTTRGRRHRQQQGWRRWLRPFAIRFPLLDPDQYLAKLLPVAKPLFTRTTFLLWLAWVSWVLVTSLSLWPELHAHWDTRFLDVGNLLWLWLLYPLVKGLHELGHALATKYWGGEVHEMGIMLLVFTPIPYVDASASTAFYHKHRRMLVGAMGVMVELFLAASALWLWQMLDTGIGKDIAFNVAVIGGMSTLLFNGNPLLRFDGYYVLADLIEIPNLGSRSNQYLGYLLKRYLFKLEGCQSPVQSRGEAPWFVGYGILSGIYRLFISFSIALYIASKLFVVGLALAVWALSSQLVLPTCRSISRLLRAAQQQDKGLPTLEMMAVMLMLGLSGLFLLPMTQSSFAKGILMLPEPAQVRAQADGFIQQINAKDGEPVKQGAALLSLENHQLQVELESNRAKQTELQARYTQALEQDRMAAGLLKDELLALDAEYQELQQQQASLQIISGTDGVLSLAREQDLAGRFVSKGQVLGYVVDWSQLSARVVIQQQAVDLVRRQTRSIEIRLASDPENIIQAVSIREVPSATNRLPSKILGSQAGGSIAVDARDQEGRLAINKIFQFEISLPERNLSAYLGQSVAVKFIHQREPLGLRWYRQLRQLMLNRFQV